jgi:large subunit ribosomal protein L15
MKLNELKPPKGAVKTGKRKGQGPGSGNGKTAGRGEKGAKSRTGYSAKLGFEGGQMPLIRRIPKRGFKNFMRKTYQIINIEQLNAYNDGETVNHETLKEMGLISSVFKAVKLLGNGELTKKLTVNVEKVSESAKKAIEEKGGRVEVKID